MSQGRNVELSAWFNFILGTVFGLGIARLFTALITMVLCLLLFVLALVLKKRLKGAS